jgi:hypothetical protein
MEKVAKNARKVKAITLLFCCFLPLSKVAKMDEKLRLYLTFLLFSLFQK